MGLLALAIVRCPTRATWTLLGAAAGLVAVSLVLIDLLPAGSGYALQGRDLLPLFALVPLLAGEVLLRRGAPLPWAVLLGRMLLPAVAVIQLAGWWINSRRHAVGTAGPLWFVGHSTWHPPHGWIPSMLLVGAGAAALALAAVIRPVEPQT